MFERLRRARSDRGMTLVELVVTVAILGLISGAIGTSMMVVLKSDRATSGRLGNTKSAQSLNTWLTADVQSATPAGGFNTDSSNTTGCAGGAAFPGVNRLRLELFDSAGVTNEPLVVSYRVLNNQLVRVTCNAANPTPVVQVLIDGIAAPSDVVVTVTASGSGAVERVRMAITATISGDTSSFSLSVSPRATVPATTVPSQPPVGGSQCTLVSAVPSGVVGLTYDALDRSRSVIIPATANITTTGICDELRVSFETRPVWLFIFPANVETVYPLGGPSTWPMTIGPSVGAGLWSVGSGTKTATVEFRLGSSWAPLGSFTFSAQQAPCTFVSGNVAPAPVTLAGTGTTMTVTSSSTLTVDLGGVCDNVDVRAQIDTRPGNTVNVALSGSGLTRTATISSATGGAAWSLTDKTAVIQQDPGAGFVAFNPPATVLFATQADLCQFLGGSLPNGTVYVTAAGTLNQTVPITVNTTNACGTQLQVLVQTGSGNTQAFTLTPNATFTTWTGTLPTSFGSTNWDAGDWFVEAQRRPGATFIDFVPEARFPMHVEALVCTVLGVSTSPSPVYINSGSPSNQRTTLAPFTLNVTTNTYCGTRLQAIIETQTNGNTGTQELVNSGSNTSWSYTFPTAWEGAAWQAGNREVNLLRRNNNNNGWTNAEVNPLWNITAGSPPACTYGSLTIGGQPLQLTGTGPNWTLSGAYPVTVTTSGFCVDVRLRFTPNTTTQNLDLASTDGTTWTTTLDVGDVGTWSSTSPKAVTVQYDTGGQNWVSFTVNPTPTIAVQTPPCAYLSAGSGVSPNVLNLLGSGLSDRTVTGSSTVTVNTTGDCSAGVQVSFAPGSGGAQTMSLTPNAAGTVWTDTIATNEFGAVWSTGVKTVTALRNGQPFSPNATFTFTAQQAPCVYTTSSGNVSGTVNLVGTLSARTVTGSNTVTIQTTGQCGGILVSFNPGAGVQPGLSLTPNGAGTVWTAAIDAATYPGLWSATSPKTITVQYFNGATWQSFSPNVTFTFTVQQAPCAVSAGSVNASVVLAGGGGTNRSIAAPTTYTLTVNTTGECSAGMRAQFNPGTGTQNLTLTQSPTNVWTATLTSSTYTSSWTLGTKTVTPQYLNGATWTSLTPTFTFATAIPCYVSATSQSGQVRLSGNSGSSRSVNGGTETFTVTTSTGCLGQMRLQFVTKTNNTVTVTLGSSGGGTTWTGTIGNNFAGANWSGGDRAVTIQQSTNGTTWVNVDGPTVPVTFTMDVEN